MRYATISTGFWTEDTSTWTAAAKLLYLWTWTNDHAHGISGIYACGDKIISAETGLSEKHLVAAKTEIGEKVRWYPGGWLWVVARAGRTCAGSNPLHIKGLLNHLSTIPPVITYDFWTVYQKTTFDGKIVISRIRKEIASPLKGHIPCITESESVNESESESDPSPKKDTPPETPPAVASCPVSEIVNAWNKTALREGLPKALKPSEKRERTIKARWREPFWRESWRVAIEKVPGSPFLCGSTGWKASFDWFIQADSVQKIMEGKYDASPNVQANVGSAAYYAFKEREEQRARERSNGGA